jgi:hypothetical protein
MKIYIEQINNLKIYQIAEVHYRYGVFSPDEKKVEQFRYLSDARFFCETTKDYLEQ